MEKLRENWAFYCWLTGLVLVAIGQAKASFDRIMGNTISENVDKLPQPAKYAICGGILLTLGHWFWPMPKKFDVHAEVDFEVNKSK